MLAVKGTLSMAFVSRDKRKDWTGQQLGVWTVKKFLGYEQGKGQIYLCEDIFRGERIFRSGQLCKKTFGGHLSVPDSVKKNLKLINTRKNIIHRCYDPKTHCYSRYGGRGIKVCDEWLEDFKNFRGWALSNDWAANLTIDRIDNDGNYCPQNCRWISIKENTRTRSSTRLSMELAQKIREEFLRWNDTKNSFMNLWAHDLGVAVTTIQAVLDNYNWN